MDILIKRLTLIKTSLELDDYTIATAQIIKLKQFTADETLAAIIHTLENAQFAKALIAINTYLKAQSSLSVYKNPEIEHLQKVYELSLTQLQDLSADYLVMQDRLETFNLAYHLHLGDILQIILRLKAEIFDLEIAKEKQKLADLQSKQSTIKELKLQKEILAEKLRQQQQNQQDKISTKEQQQQAKQQQQETYKINVAEEKQLKTLYRKATKLCHPDVIDKKFYKQANATFAKLSVAYKKKDLAVVSDIYQALTSGIIDINQSIKEIDNIEVLRKKITIIEAKIAKKQQQIAILEQDEHYIKITEIDDFDSYWRLKKTSLEQVCGNLLKYKEQLKAEISGEKLQSAYF